MSPQPPKPPHGQGKPPGKPQKPSGPLPNWTPPRDPAPARPQQRPQPQQPQHHGKPGKPAPQPQMKKPVAGPTMVHFACPSCGQPFSMPAKAANRKAKCPCGARLVVPPPGGVPRAIWMPDEEVRKKAQKSVRESGSDKNATEIALETSPAKMAMYAGVVVAGVIGFFVWRNQNAAAPTDTSARGSSDDSSDSTPTEMTAAEIVAQRGPGIVTVEALDAGGTVLGSCCGFVASPSQVVTSFNITLGAAQLRCRFKDGTAIGASGLTAFDPALDVAVAALDQAELTPLPFASAPALAGGDRIVVVGQVVGFEHQMKEGKLEGTASEGGVWRMSVPVTPVNAGGPVFDRNGEIIGVVVTVGGGKPGVAPADRVKSLLEETKVRALTEISAAAADRPVEEVLREAKRLLARGSAKPAISMLEKAATRGTPGTALLNALGEALLSDGRPRAARRKFGDAQKSSKNWESLSGIGQTWLEQGEYERAVPSLRMAVSSGGGDDAVTLAALSLALARLGDMDRAAPLARKAVDGARTNRRALFLLAQAFARMKNETSTKMVEELAGLGPEAGLMLWMRGAVLLDWLDTEKALEHFDKARDSGYLPRAHIGRAKALEKLGQAEQAIQAYRDALSVRFDDEEALYPLARLLESAGNVEEAIAQYRTLIGIAPTDPEPNFRLGLMVSATDPAKALGHFKTAHDASPDTREYVIRLAASQELAGDPAAAMKTLAAYLGRHPGDPDIATTLAVLKAPEAPQEAIDLVKGLAVTGVSAGRAAFARGLALMEMEKLVEARLEFDMAVSFDPENGLYRFNRCFAAEGEDIHTAAAQWDAYVAWARKRLEEAARLEKAVARLKERYGR